MAERMTVEDMHADVYESLGKLAAALGGDHFIHQRPGDVPVLVIDGYEIAVDPTNSLYDVWRNGHIVRTGMTAKQLATGIDDALEDDSDVIGGEVAQRRRARLAPLKERILTYLRHEGDQWEPWPEVVEAVDGRMLAEISPINGRIRQAALALSQDGQVEIRYGARSIFEAVRLLPAGYTSDDED